MATIYSLKRIVEGLEDTEVLGTVEQVQVNSGGTIEHLRIRCLLGGQSIVIDPKGHPRQKGSGEYLGAAHVQPNDLVYAQIRQVEGLNLVDYLHNVTTDIQFGHMKLKD